MKTKMKLFASTSAAIVISVLGIANGLSAEQTLDRNDINRNTLNAIQPYAQEQRILNYIAPLPINKQPSHSSINTSRNGETQFLASSPQLRSIEDQAKIEKKTTLTAECNTRNHRFGFSLSKTKTKTHTK